ncbi:MAG: D-alanyl-D-alanine carboxypeptidase, partial [Pyrinomonadaceae bacterium]|nr:D-alanyl-D-alanine carboxypeptidase [Sphingobacteriaceae bacterium]
MIRKVKKKKPRIHIFIIFLLVVVFATFGYKSIITQEVQHVFEKEYGDKTPSYSSLKITSDFSGDRTKPVTSSKIETGLSVSLSPDKLNSHNVILTRLKDQATIVQKKSEEKIYPASLTKMMTAIVAIENLPNLREEIKLTNSMFQGLYGSGASMAGFKPGERVLAIDLLYGALLPSGAECCIGLADQIAGSEQNFVKIMNQKAADLDMKNTHFENATGLQNENHYTTVKDLSILLSYALQNDTFR